MNSQFAGYNISTHALRAELISRSRAGDKKAPELLRVIAKSPEETAGELVTQFHMRAGSSSLETAMAGLGLVSFGLVVGIIALTASGLVTADLETLLVLLAAFASGQWGFLTYSKQSTSRYYAQEFQKLANIVKVSDMVRQQYAEASRKQAAKDALAYAYGSVA
jgi:hypothetical protein